MSRSSTTNRPRSSNPGRMARSWLLRLDLASSPEEAKALVGREISIDASDLEAPAGGEYYHFQLAGLEVIDESGERVGCVREVIAAPGNDLLVIDGPSRECLVPVAGEFIRSVDLGLGRIVIRPIPGLIGPVK